MRKKLIGGAALLIAALLACIFLTIGGFPLKINGLAVTEEEYFRMMNTKTYDVSQELSERFGLRNTAGFWMTDVGGIPAYQILADRTVEALTEFRAFYELAMEQGYVTDISYAALLERVETENEIRKEKEEKGETVYGISNFSVELFLEYEASIIRTRYCEDAMIGEEEFAGLVAGRAAAAAVKTDKEALYRFTEKAVQ